MAPLPESKECKDCGRELPVAAFAICRGRTRSGEVTERLDTRCRECAQELNAVHHAAAMERREEARGLPPGYTEPSWGSGGRDGDVAGQIRAILERQRRHGVGWGLAWKCVMRSVKYPHEHSERHGWYELLTDESFIERCWKTAFEREPSGLGGDLALVHGVIEGDASRDARRTEVRSPRA